VQEQTKQTSQSRKPLSKWHFEERERETGMVVTELGNCRDKLFRRT
jgi:hypothetical protein